MNGPSTQAAYLPGWTCHVDSGRSPFFASTIVACARRYASLRRVIPSVRGSREIAIRLDQRRLRQRMFDSTNGPLALLHCVERPIQFKCRRRMIIARVGVRAWEQRERVERCAIRTEYDCTLHHVLQFANVSGVIVLEQSTQCAFASPGDDLSVPVGELLEEVMDQQRQIFASVTK